MFQVFSPTQKPEKSAEKKPVTKSLPRKKSVKKQVLQADLSCVFVRVYNSFFDLDDYLADHLMSKYDLLQVCKSCKKCKQFTY
jgi:hypothetical protein